MEQLASDTTWAEALRRAGTAIAPLNVDGDRIPIYWVHSVTGVGTDAIRLARFLGPQQPFYSIRAPSSNRTASFASSVESMASYYTKEIIQFQPQGPLIIGGWSAGVVVALEMARQLKAAGRDVRHLVAVDFAPFNTGVKLNSIWTFALGVPYWLYREGTKRTSWSQVAKRIAEKVSEAARTTFTKAHPQDKLIEFLKYTEVEGDFVRRLSDEVERYVPVSYPGSVLFYAAVEDDGKAVASYRNMHSNSMIRVWQLLAADLTVSTIIGDHNSLLRGNSVVDLARRLEADLQGANMISFGESYGLGSSEWRPCVT
jgi:thioesterase domain-containing protein